MKSLSSRACFNILLVSAVLTTACIIQDANAANTWVGGSVGTDVRNLPDLHTFAIEAGRFAETKGWGWEVYAERGRLDEDQDLNTLGLEFIYRYKFFFAGIGPAYSDDETDVTGTRWNFSIPMGLRFEHDRVFIDVLWRHRSHGAALGFAEDERNSGINLFQLRGGLKF